MVRKKWGSLGKREGKTQCWGKPSFWLAPERIRERKKFRKRHIFSDQDSEEEAVPMVRGARALPDGTSAGAS